tara:strand:+ start:9709 stop:11529 length:1821 start_codon:yes stop_codon:yes gene_type:complete
VFIRLLILSFFLSIPIGSYGQYKDYLWPTDASQHLTSTFGETRSGHFHSGLDIKTWGREGYKVFASKDGIVHRLGVSAVGYGKVIYLKHNDGSFTVYAHLQRLNDELQAYVDSVRMIDHSFETELFVEDLNFRVSQGDVIGFTGSTGVGPPHLHFEIRDSTDKPINALRSNLKVEDNIPPTFSALLIFPLSNETTIRGSKFPQLYYPSKNEFGEIDFGTIETDGPIGLTVSTFDEANGVTNKYAVYELGLLHEQDTLFYERIDRFKFEEDDVMFTDRLAAFGASRRSYQTLFKKDGPINPFYRILDPRSTINLVDSVSEYTIFAKDYYGNTTMANIVVEGKKIDRANTKETKLKPLNEWYWTENWAFTGTKTLDLENLDLGFEWNNENNQKITFNSNTPVLWSRFKPTEPYSIVSPNQNLSVRFLENTFFDTLTVVSYSAEYSGYPYINLQPGMIPSRKEFKIEFFLNDNFQEKENYQLFRLNRSDNTISYIDSKLIGKTIHATPSNLGEFLIIADNDPPVLHKPKLVQTDFGKWFVEISAIDSLSGINFKESQVFVNGIKGIVEFDNEKDLLIYYHPSFYPKKENIITVRISDNAGNIYSNSYRL